jgi:hypothetical protein
VVAAVAVEAAVAVAVEQAAVEASGLEKDELVVIEAAVELAEAGIVVTAAAATLAILEVCEQDSPGSLCQART